MHGSLDLPELVYAHICRHVALHLFILQLSLCSTCSKNGEKIQLHILCGQHCKPSSVQIFSVKIVLLSTNQLVYICIVFLFCSSHFLISLVLFTCTICYETARGLTAYTETASSTRAWKGSPSLFYLPKFQLLLFLASESKSFTVKTSKELMYF